MHIPISYFNDSWQPDPAGLNFRGTIPVENGADSQAIASCYLRWSGMWGSGSFRGAALDAAMKGVADTGWTTLAPGPDKDYWLVPDAARSVYVEGRRGTPSTVVAALVLPIAK